MKISEYNAEQHIVLANGDTAIVFRNNGSDDIVPTESYVPPITDGSGLGLASKMASIMLWAASDVEMINIICDRFNARFAPNSTSGAVH